MTKFWTVQQHDTQLDRTDLDCVEWDTAYRDHFAAKRAIEAERVEMRDGEAISLLWTDTEGRLLAQDEENLWTVWTIVQISVQ